ncbi:MAG: ribonuclease H-like domain-containing protein, partial [Caldilineaceae bacterium]|nr:ribonuclease H-like domain-containing protein [Caldilineaceae bacterium]
FTLLAHNGVGFDFDILAEESGMHDTCADLALHSVDTCLLVHCLKGFPVGLEAIAKGMGLQGKTEGMNGSMAPQMWAEGKFNEVLEYVAQDVRATLQVALEIEKRKGLTWIAKSGRRNSLPIPKLLTAYEALQLPEPDTSWMTEPISRERFTSWMEARQNGNV